MDDGVEVSKPGHYKRFVICQSEAEMLWLGRLVAPLGCTLRRLTTYQSNAVQLPHYYLPEDSARAVLELNAYYGGAPGRTLEQHRALDEQYNGRVGDYEREKAAFKNNPSLGALFSLMNHK